MRTGTGSTNPILRAISVVVVVVALGGVAAFGCGADTTAVPLAGGLGEVALGVRVAENVNLTLVNFRISGNGIEPIEGQMPVANLSATASALIAGIADGSDYRVEINAISTDGVTICAGSGTFDVRAGQNSPVNVVIQCRPRVPAAPAVVVTACGNQVVEPGEECEPPARGMCSQTCQKIAVCGNGIVEKGEQCDGPDGVTCDAACRVLVAASSTGAPPPP